MGRSFPNLDLINVPATQLNPKTLVAESVCVETCIPPEARWAVLVSQFVALNDMNQTDAAALLEVAKCINSCIPKGMQKAVLISLAQKLAGDDSTAQQLVAQAKCIEKCVPPSFYLPVLIYLVSLLQGGDTGVCIGASGVGSPVNLVTPQFSGQLYHDTVGGDYYRATGLTTTDWSLIAPRLGLVGDWTTIDSGTDAFLTDNGTTSPAIRLNSQVNYDFSWIQFANGTLIWGGSGGPTSVDFSGLVTVPTSGVFIVTFSNCNSLTTIIPPAALGSIVNGGLTLNFNNCSLNQASVNGLLNALAADATVQNCTIDLSGGTSAAPSGPAVAAKAELIGRGCTVTTN